MIRIARIDAIRLDLNTYNGNIYNEIGGKANMATTFKSDQLQKISPYIVRAFFVLPYLPDYLLNAKKTRSILTTRINSIVPFK